MEYVELVDSQEEPQLLTFGLQFQLETREDTNNQGA